MAFSRRLVASVLLFLVLVVASETGTTVVEARHCLSQSHKFKGMCLSSSNCGSVCNTEGFPGGECRSHDLERKCFCKKQC